MACIVKRKLDFSPYVHKAYYVGTNAKTYCSTFHGMPSHKHWPISQLDKPLSPPFRNMQRRPTKTSKGPSLMRVEMERRRRILLKGTLSKTSVGTVERLAITKRLARTHRNKMRHPRVQHQLKEEEQKSILV